MEVYSIYRKGARQPGRWRTVPLTAGKGKETDSELPWWQSRYESTCQRRGHRITRGFAGVVENSFMFLTCFRIH